MTILTDKIASWEENPPERQFLHQSTIATEMQLEESPTWDTCTDALLQIWAERSSTGNDSDSQPNRNAIEAAITWIAFLRKRFPVDPPTCITPEPEGGIIVERRIRSSDGHDFLCELTFYNDGTAERTDYFDGRILRMDSIPARAPLIRMH